MSRCFLLLIFVGILFGCSRPVKKNEQGNALSGEFNVYCDEAFRPVISTLATTYMAQYKNVKINLTYGHDAGNLQRIGSGDFETIVTSSVFTPGDSSMLNKAKIFFHIYPFASDAVIAITNPGNADSTLDISHQSQVLCGGNDTSNRSSLVIYTDGRSTDNTNTVLQKIPYSKNCVNQWFACGSDTGVVSYIDKNKDAIGFISYSLICDKDDSVMAAIKSKIKILKLNNPEKEEIGFINPTQETISNKNYPVTRKINLITTEKYAGPATGFAAYVASHEGQQIIRLLGLVPATMPTREVIIN